MQSGVRANTSGVLKMLSDAKKNLKIAPRGVQAGFYKDESVGPNGPTPSHIIAKANEFGVPSKNIPPRPFMRNATVPAQKRGHNIIKARMDDGADLTTALQSAGVAMAEEIRKSIRSNTPPPNAPATIKRKGSTHTLIDTGAMLGAIHWGLINKKAQKE